MARARVPSARSAHSASRRGLTTTQGPRQYATAPSMHRSQGANRLLLPHHRTPHPARPSPASMAAHRLLLPHRRTPHPARASPASMVAHRLLLPHRRTPKPQPRWLHPIGFFFASEGLCWARTVAPPIGFFFASKGLCWARTVAPPSAFSSPSKGLRWTRTVAPYSKIPALTSPPQGRRCAKSVWTRAAKHRSPSHPPRW